MAKVTKEKYSSTLSYDVLAPHPWYTLWADIGPKSGVDNTLIVSQFDGAVGASLRRYTLALI